MRSRSSLSWLLLCAPLAAADVNAESPEPADEDESAEKYTVVVSSDPESRAAFEASRGLRALSDKRLARAQARSLPEALSQAPGVFLQETNRGAGTPILRGLVGPSNLTLIDGVRFNTSTYRTGPNQYLALVDPFSIERAEVLRGPGSVSYGNGAMGGIVHLLTRDPLDFAKGWGGFAGLLGATADTNLGAVGELRYGTEHVGLLVGGSFRHFGELRTGGGFIEPISSYSSGSWRAKAAFRLNEKTSVTASYLSGLMRNAGRTEALGRGDVRAYDNDDHLVTLSLVRSNPEHTGSLRQLRATLSYHQLREDSSRWRCKTNDDGVVRDLNGCQRFATDALRQIQTYNDVVHVPGALVRGQWGFLDADRLVIEAGGDAYYDMVKSSATKAKPGETAEAMAGQFADGSTYFDSGAFAQGRFRLHSFTSLGHLQLTGGGRLSHIRANAPGVPVIGEVKYQFTGLVGSAGVQLVKANSHNLFVNFVQGFRAPNLQETAVVGDTGSKYELPNANLRPEKSNTLEVGARGTRGPVTASLVYFRSWLRDNIDEVAGTFNGSDTFDGKPVVQRVNAGDGLYQGVEAELQLRFKQLRFDSAVTAMEGEVTLPSGEQVPGRRVPPPFGRAGVTYTSSDRVWWAELFALGAMPQKSLHPSDALDLRICETARFSGLTQEQCTGTAGWATVNLRGSYTFLRRYTVQASLLNVLDKRYRQHGSGIDAPGRDLRVSVMARF